MDLTADFDADCPPGVLFGYVADLGSYPRWFEVVHRAALEIDLVDVTPTNGGGPAWSVDLRGRLGPMARSKRLRMVRSVCDEPAGRVRFERQELDGRQHSAWVLDARVEEVGAGSRLTGSRLTVDLHYGGQFGGTLLRRMLSEEIERSRPRLAALVAASQ